MAARYLHLPNGATGPPSGFSPSLMDQQTLHAYLSDVSQDVAINIAGEGFSSEYPTVADVGSFVLNGGVYVDMCGWPMWWEWDASMNNWTEWALYGGDILTWGGAFDQFLQSIGVATDYFITFFPWSNADYGLPYLTCNVVYQREWISSWRFPQSNSVIIAPSVIDTCQDDSGNVYYGYGMIGIRAGSGWYFWASGNTGGAHVNPTQYAQWIRSVLGYQANVSGGTGIKQCGPGQSLLNGQCVTPGKGGSVTPPAASSPTNWPLIIGGGLALVGIVVAAVALGGKK